MSSTKQSNDPTRPWIRSWWCNQGGWPKSTSGNSPWKANLLEQQSSSARTDVLAVQAAAWCLAAPRFSSLNLLHDVIWEVVPGCTTWYCGPSGNYESFPVSSNKFCSILFSQNGPQWISNKPLIRSYYGYLDISILWLYFEKIDNSGYIQFGFPFNFLL